MKMLDNSILVVAHPDDEILWFSSVVLNVKEVIIIFQDVPSQPIWSKGRQKSIPELPLKNVKCLKLTESEAFNGANWSDPVVSPYGLQITEIPDKKHSMDNYESNYHVIIDKLRPILKKYDNIFTHNPWGEYGHEEHVQVFRAIQTLKKELEFNIWFSNYCSNKSFPLMQKYISGFVNQYYSKETNPQIAIQCMEIYKHFKCWTWYDDYQWFNEECFLSDNELKEPQFTYGSLFPLNILKVELPAITKKKHNRSYRYLKNLLSKSGMRRRPA